MQFQTDCKQKPERHSTQMASQTNTVNCLYTNFMMAE